VSNDVISAEEKMVIRLDITSSMISSEKMTKATREGFENATNDNIFPIKAEIDRFMSAFSEEIKEGDTFEFAYEPTEGVVVTKNGMVKETISSKHFKRALFGIWLSDNPAQDSLKEEMLGR
jgi:regulatory protein YycH of two-component signal transduction system YycFG